jgi:hypothetical protein
MGEVLSRGKGYMAHSSIDQQVIGCQRLSLSSLAVVNALWAAHRDSARLVSNDMVTQYVART